MYHTNKRSINEFITNNHLEKSLLSAKEKVVQLIGDIPIELSLIKSLDNDRKQILAFKMVTGNIGLDEMSTVLDELYEVTRKEERIIFLFKSGR